MINYCVTAEKLFGLPFEKKFVCYFFDIILLDLYVYYVLWLEYSQKNCRKCFIISSYSRSQLRFQLEFRSESQSKFWCCLLLQQNYNWKNWRKVWWSCYFSYLLTSLVGISDGEPTAFDILKNFWIFWSDMWLEQTASVYVHLNLIWLRSPSIEIVGINL